MECRLFRQWNPIPFVYDYRLNTYFWLALYSLLTKSDHIYVIVSPEWYAAWNNLWKRLASPYINQRPKDFRESRLAYPSHQRRCTLKSGSLLFYSLGFARDLYLKRLWGWKWDMTAVEQTQFATTIICNGCLWIAFGCMKLWSCLNSFWVYDVHSNNLHLPRTISH